MNHHIIILFAVILSFYTMPLIINVVYYFPWLWASYDMFIKYKQNKDVVDSFILKNIQKAKDIINELQKEKELTK
jgi:hypothetical protein